MQSISMVYDAVVHLFNSFPLSFVLIDASTKEVRTHLIGSGQKMVTSVLFMKQVPLQRTTRYDV